MDPAFFHSEKLTAGHFYEDFISAFAYEGKIRDSVLKFKYSGRAEYASFYAEALFAYAGRRIKSWHADALVPVPADKRREIERGYNQAELLAKELSKVTGIKEDSSLMIRSRKTKPQKELGLEERRANLSSAFSCTGLSVPERIIVVDDILTTGATIDAVASCLIKAGARHIFALTICADL